MNMKTILVVDDEAKIVQIARDYLRHAGFNVISAADGPAALEMVRTQSPDLMILDLGLPQMDGLDVTRAVRKLSNLPIIMLTARAEESDKVAGLELGADDYITKPFSPKELVARVRSVLRRLENPAGREEVIQAGGLVLDLPRMRAEVDGRAVDLTATEFQLLAVMAAQPGRIFTRAQLLEAIHGMAIDSYERAIDAHIKNIRHKIEVDSKDPQFVLKVYGVGYKFSDR